MLHISLNLLNSLCFNGLVKIVESKVIEVLVAKKILFLLSFIEIFMLGWLIFEDKR